MKILSIAGDRLLIGNDIQCIRKNIFKQSPEKVIRLCLSCGTGMH